MGFRVQYARAREGAVISQCIRLWGTEASVRPINGNILHHAQGEGPCHP